MDNNKREKLQELIKKNKIRLKQKYLSDNELFQNCLKKITDAEIIEENAETENIVDLMESRFNIKYHHVDSSYEISPDKLFLNSEQKYYIIWDNADIPVLKCSGKYILQCLEDVFSVDFDTYIVSENFKEIIHCDESDRLWRYFYGA